MLLGVAVGVVALLLSLVSGPRAWLHSEGHLHVWYHLGLFAVLGLLAMHRSQRPSMRLCWVMVAMMLGVCHRVRRGDPVRRPAAGGGWMCGRTSPAWWWVRSPDGWCGGGAPDEP